MYLYPEIIQQGIAVAYEIFLSYERGATSHNYQTDSRRLIFARLHELLTEEEETRQLADRIILKRAGKIILDMPTSANNKEIIKAVCYPRVGAPRKIDTPVSKTFYLPKKAVDFLEERGKGSASKGLKQILIETGGEEMSQVFRPKK